MNATELDNRIKIAAQFICIMILSFFVVTAFAEDTTVPIVKMSGTKKCHGEESPSYEKTKHFTPYKTYAECFKAKGILPNNVTDEELLKQFQEYQEREKIGLIEDCNKGDKEKCLQLGEADIKAQNAEKKLEEARDFAGFRFGVGIAFTHLSERVINDVSIIDGTVFVNDSNKNQATLMLESHTFIAECRRFIKNRACRHGPFVAISLTDEDGADPLTAFGAGWMMGFKEPNNSDSWNVGAGVFVNTEATILRDGVKDGESTTLSDSSQLTVNKDEVGVMILFSTTW